MVREHENHKKIKLINNIVTKLDLVESFKAMGLTRGMIVYVQSQMHHYAHVNGSNQTIIDALQEVVGYEGTIVMSAFSEHLLDPACQKGIRFQRDVYEEMRSTCVAFHKKRTPANNELANQLMRNDIVYRSNHPLHSCVAWGKYAKLICDKHPLHFSLGKDSFLEKVCDMNGYVLLLGVAYDECDIFKYATTIAQKAKIQIVTSPIDKKGKCEYVQMLDIAYDKQGIATIKTMLEERKVVNDGFIANAHCRFFKAKEAANLALAHYHSFE